jgi:hypothetical protein
MRKAVFGRPQYKSLEPADGKFGKTGKSLLVQDLPNLMKIVSRVPPRYLGEVVNKRNFFCKFLFLGSALIQRRAINTKLIDAIWCVEYYPLGSNLLKL